MGIRALSLKRITGSEGLDLGGENAGLAALAAGAILGPAGYGLTATQAALATGGAMALATGSLQKGLMAGLQAYGTSGLQGAATGGIDAAKSEIAKQFKFPIKNFGEDTDWAMQICKSGLLKKEVEVNKIIYYYQFITNK